MTDIARIGFDADARPVDKAENSLNRFAVAGNKAHHANDNFNTSAKAGRPLALGLASAVAKLATAVGAYAIAQNSIQNARTFQSALVETKTLIEGTREEMASLERQSLSLTRMYGGTGAAQVKAFYQAISAGAGGVEQAGRLLDDANKLAVGGITDVTTAVDVLTTATNAYGIEALSTAAASDALFVGMKAGKTTIGEMSASLGNVIPLASAAGVEFDELVGGVAALTTQGQTTSVAVTGLRAIIASVLKPTQQATEQAKLLGLEFNAQALEAQGLQGFLQQVIEKTNGNKAAMAQLFGGVEALNAVLAFAGGAGETFADVMEDMGNKAGATDEAFNKVADGLDQRLNAALGKFNAASTQLGNMLLTVLVPVMEVAAENLDHLTVLSFGFAAAAATAVIPALAGMVVGLGKFVVGLRLSRAALISTGIGALVVLLGEAYLWFNRSGDAAAQFGTVLRAVGDLASSMWSYIVLQAQAIPPGLAAIWLSVQASFMSLAQSIRSIWAQVIGVIADTTTSALDAIPEWARAAVPGIDSVGDALQNAADRAKSSAINTGIRIDQLTEKSQALKGEAEALRREAGENVAGAMLVLSEAILGTTDSTESATKAATDFNTVLEETEEQAVDTEVPVVGLGDAAGGAGKKLKGAAEEARGFNAALKEAALTSEDLGERKAQSLISGIDSISDAWGNFVASGFTDFKGFADAVFGTFTKLISDMISLAVRNRIMIGLGIQVPGGGIGAGLGQGGGLLGPLSNGGGLLGSLTSGAGIFGSGGFFGQIGSSLGTGLGSLLGGAGSSLATSLGSIGASIGAALPVIGIAAAAFSFFKSKTKDLDSGLRVLVNGLDEAVVQTFLIQEKTRFWGLSKKTIETVNAADREVADPIQSAINSIGDQVMSLSDRLGLATKNLNDVDFKFDVSTKGKTDQEIQEALEREFTRLGDAFAGAVVGTYTELLPDESLIREIDEKIKATYNLGGRGGGTVGIQRRGQLELEREAAQTAVVVTHVNESFAQFQLEGEGTLETLNRLVLSLDAVNEAFYLMDRNALASDLSMAGAAAALVELSGGLDQFTNKTAFVFDNFLTDAQRETRLTEIAIDRLNSGLEGITNTIPKTHEQFLALMEAQDLTTESGRNAYATLLSVSDAFIQLRGTAQNFSETARREAEIESALGVFDARKTQASDSLREAEQALRDAFSSAREDLITENQRRVSDAQNALSQAQANFQNQVTSSEARKAFYQGIHDALKDAISQRVMDDVSNQARQLKDATQFLRDSIENGITDEKSLNRALQTVSKPSEELFSSFSDYEQSFNVNTNLMKRLKDDTEDSLSVEESTLQSIRNQSTIVTQGFNSQIAVLNQNHEKELQSLDSQLSALLGINNSVMSLADAISFFKEAQSNNRSLNPSIDSDPTSFASGSFAEWLDQVFYDNLGRGVRQGGLEYYGNQFANGVDRSVIENEIANSQEAKEFALSGIPRFELGTNGAKGGYSIVGEGGIEIAELARGSTVHNRAQSMRMLDNRELLRQAEKAQRENQVNMDKLYEISTLIHEETRRNRINSDEMVEEGVIALEAN